MIWLRKWLTDSVNHSMSIIGLGTKDMMTLIIMNFSHLYNYTVFISVHLIIAMALYFPTSQDVNSLPNDHTGRMSDPWISVWETHLKSNISVKTTNWQKYAYLFLIIITYLSLLFQYENEKISNTYWFFLLKTLNFALFDLTPHNSFHNCRIIHIVTK